MRFRFRNTEDQIPLLDTSVDPMCTATPGRCRWGCGNQCAHTPPNTTAGDTFDAVVRRFVSRRGFLQGGAAAAGVLVAAGTPGLGALVGGGASGASAQEAGAALPQTGDSSLTFRAIAPSTADRIVVAPGYTANTLIAWGDPLFTGAGPEGQFGYNNDFLGYLPFDARGGLLLANLEYTNPELMFPGYDSENPTQEQVDIELAAHGVAIVEIARTREEIIETRIAPRGPQIREVRTGRYREAWSYVIDAPLNRRITATTPIEITGPAAGHVLLQTSEDPTGTVTSGVLNNCSAGITPWGTLLTCEENFNQYFANASLVEDEFIAAAHARYGMTPEASERKWERFYPRFDNSIEPNEPFRYGYVVEIDPNDPTSTPRKHTALGRVKHEAANPIVNGDGRVVVYMGDDERFDYIYRFVSDGVYDEGNRAANMNLLDSGTLYAARFNDDGTGEWLPLVAGEGPLTAENGFPTQAEVCVLTRLAGDLVGATKMDRPEDVQPNPVNGKIYAVMTNNTNRSSDQLDEANPRPENRWGHIIEMTPDGGDHAANTFTWTIFMLCGDPTDESTYFAGFDKSLVSAIANPDNITFDNEGNLWISTDGQPGVLDMHDSVYAVPVDGPERGYVRRFLSAVIGAETASLAFDDANKALFVSIQHPGEGSTYEEPSSSFPGDDGIMRPAVVVVTSDEGEVIGL